MLSLFGSGGPSSVKPQLELRVLIQEWNGWLAACSWIFLHTSGIYLCAQVWTDPVSPVYTSTPLHCVTKRKAFFTKNKCFFTAKLFASVNVCDTEGRKGVAIRSWYEVALSGCCKLLHVDFTQLKCSRSQINTSLKVSNECYSEEAAVSGARLMAN